MTIIEHPFSLFAKWLKEACITAEPYGILSTIKQNLSPASRVVLFKTLEDQNFTFCTNLNSNKSKEILLNNKVSICFYWENIGKQVRIEGNATQITRDSAIEFFQKRPREHQIASLASKQSTELTNQQLLLSEFKRLSNEYAGKEIPTPDWWTGFSIKPYSYEFWERGDFRLHHRTIYNENKSGTWDTKFLYP